MFRFGSNFRGGLQFDHPAIFCGVTCDESSRSKVQASPVASPVDNCITSTFVDVSDVDYSTDNAAVSNSEQEIQ